jgi:hypothetical protein
MAPDLSEMRRRPPWGQLAFVGVTRCPAIHGAMLLDHRRGILVTTRCAGDRSAAPGIAGSTGPAS